MAEPYLEQLSHIADRLGTILYEKVTLETKHFFSGATLCANGRTCAILGPAGLAVKLPPQPKQSLIKEGKGREFRFFNKGPVKREYVLLSEAIVQDEESLAQILDGSATVVAGSPDSSS